MAQFFALFDVLETRVVFQLQQQSGICVYHNRVTSIGTDTPTMQQVVDLMAQFENDEWKGITGSSTTYRGHGMRKVKPTPPTAEVINTAFAGVGTFGTDPLPKQVTAVLTKRTLFAGPRGRGRIYVPFPPASANFTDATPTAAYITALTTLANRLDDVITYVVGGATVEFSPVVFQRDQAQSSNLITSITVADKWGTQRRRGDYGRTNVPPF